MTRTSTANGRVLQSPAIARTKDRRGFVSKQGASHCQEVDGTQSIHRALHVLRLLASSAASGMRLVDIAHGARLHHSTTHRILRALEQEGIVERLVNSRRYTIGSEVVWLGLGASSRGSRSPWLRHERSTDSLNRSATRSFYQCTAGTISICADRRIGSYPIQVLSIAIGSRRPLGVSQGGRVILAFLPQCVAQQVIAENADRYARHDLHSRRYLRKHERGESARLSLFGRGNGQKGRELSLCPFWTLVAAPLLQLVSSPFATVCW